jgi:uncharacterized protein (DUF1778 family)
VEKAVAINLAVRVNVEHRRLLERAAAYAGMQLSTWVRTAALEKARRTLPEAEVGRTNEPAEAAP